MYTLQLRLTKEQFRVLAEQANSIGQSPERVAVELIGGNLERLARFRVGRRKAAINQLAREVEKPLPADPALAQKVEQDQLRRLAGIPDPYKR